MLSEEPGEVESDWLTHLVQVRFTVATQRHGVQIRLRVFDGLPDDAGFGGGASGVGGHQLHLDLTHLVMRHLRGLEVPPSPLIGCFMAEGGARGGAWSDAGRGGRGRSFCRRKKRVKYQRIFENFECFLINKFIT